MNLFLPIGAAIAAVIAFVLSKDKEKKGSGITADASGEVIVPYTTSIPAVAAAANDALVQSGIPIMPTGSAPVGISAMPTMPVLTTSAGWPSIVPQQGPTSGAVSVSSTGAVDDAFDELLAKAIATGDIAQLNNLAMQALYRGMPDVAESIRAEIARLTITPPVVTAIPAPTAISAPVSSPYGRATISMKAGSRGADVVEWQRITKVKQDGIFGPITDTATRAWQKAHSLVVDGIVGPKTWAAAYAVQPTLATTPRPPVVVTTSTSRPTISMKLGSKGPVVIEWQGIVKVKADGIFGPITDSATKTWQRSRGLVADGIVGPKTWEAAYKAVPALSVTAPVATAVPTSTTTRSTIKLGSRGADVTEWQRIIGVKQDGIFGPITESTTRVWQKARPPLVVDGIVGPKTWAAAYSGVQPTATISLPIVQPAAIPVVEATTIESDMRTAARELTSYLVSIGGLAGRGREDKMRLSAWMSRMGVPDPKGLYGRGSARAVMQQGFVPVVPFYWPSTGTAAAKSEFIALAKQYKASDPSRGVEWDKLIFDVGRS